MVTICVFFSSRRRHTRYWRDWSSDVCSSDLLGEFKEILQDSEADYTKLKKKMANKEELLKKASVSYIEKLEVEVKEIEKEIKKKEDLMKWSSTPESFKQEIQQLQQKIEKKREEETDYKNQEWDKIEVENLLKFYDEKITGLEEYLDQKVEEKNKKLAINEMEIKKIVQEIDSASKKPIASYYTEQQKEKKLKDLEAKKKVKEEENKEKDDKINEEFLSEKKKIDEEINKLKEDLKDEEVQEFLTILERREFSEATIKHLEKLKEENMKRENPMTKDRKSTRLNSSHAISRMPSSA